jgi:predicted ATPase
VAQVPSGTVTFLFTDIAGSTRLWQEHPDAMQPALARHDELVRTAIEAHGGYVVKTTGDGFHAAFTNAHDAIDAAVEAQLALTAEAWTLPEAIEVRMGIHSGPAEQRDGDYYGTTVNRAARLMSVAHGGQIVVSRATEELVQDRAVELVDIGEHALRDLARPERVFQVVAPGLPREFARLSSLDAFPGNLPAQVTSFVGRDAELALVIEHLGQSRLVTLTGVGGVGKTRLALQVGAEVLPRFADGVWLCELAAATDGDALVQIVATATGVSPLPEMTLEASIVRVLRGKRLLILLDNCEHLLGQASSLAERILRECPEVRILATSREGLGVTGEQMVAVRSLALPEPEASFATLAQSDAVVLFADRAGAARAGFLLDAGNADAVAEVCRRLDGIPLAIELAAARVASMNPADIAQRIDERFRLLTGGRRVGIERHQTLRATVDWSYSLLEPVEQLVFDRLSVFSGTFGVHAPESVVVGDGVEGWDVVDALASLVVKSMVLIDDSADGEARYQLLETMRAYGRERLDDRGETDAWRRRHAEYFTDLAERLGELVLGPDEITWRRRLRLELDNLRAAVAWSLDATSADDQRLVLRVIAALGYEITLDRAAGYGEWAERALALLPLASPPQRYAILGVAAFSAIHRGNVDEAARLANTALANGLPDGAAAANLPYVALANVESARGNDPGAVEWLRTAEREICRSDGYDYEHANLRAVRGIFVALDARLDDATDATEEAVTLSKALGNPSQMAIALGAHGFSIRLRDPVAARAALEESLALTRAGASDIVTSLALSTLAQLRAADGDHDAALPLLRDAIIHNLACGDRPGLLGGLVIAVDVLASLHEYEIAARCIAITTAAGFEALGTTQREEHERSVARVREALGTDGLDRALTHASTETFDTLVAEVIHELDELSLADPG